MPGPPRLPVAVGEPGGRVIASAVSLLWPVPPRSPRRDGSITSALRAGSRP